MTAIGSVLYVCGGDDTPDAACEGTAGTIPLSPVGELGATTGAIESGSAAEEAGVDSCASTAGGAAADPADADGRTAGGRAAGGAAAVTGPAGSADAILTGSAAGTDGAVAAATGADAAPTVTGASVAGAEAALTVAAPPEVAAAASTGPLPVSAGLETADDAVVALAGRGSLEAGGLVAAANGPLVLSAGFTSTA